MLLCDIGNTSFHFLDDNSDDYKESVKTFNPESITKEVYFISVNQKIKDSLVGLENWIDISGYIDMKKYYHTMGIDRIFAIESVKYGIIIDAGSAITVDIVKGNVFQGGFIYPGIAAMQKTYENISPALSYSFNFECDLGIMPKNSQDSISYGFLKTLYSEVMSHNMPIILTGGDSEKFKKIFDAANVDNRLIFNGMKKIIKEHKELKC